MILAVADYVDGNGSPPPDLELALDCEQWGSLPEPGALRQQYAGEMTRMRAALNVYRTLRSFNAALAAHKAGQWRQDNPAGDKLVGQIMEAQMARDNG